MTWQTGDIARWHGPNGRTVVGQVREVRLSPSLIDGWTTEPCLIVRVAEGPFSTDWMFPLSEAVPA